MLHFLLIIATCLILPVLVLKCNSEDWGSDDGKEPGMTPKFDCVKSFMDTDVFRGFSAKYGLVSEIIASFYESFATQVDLPKEKWFI